MDTVGRDTGRIRRYIQEQEAEDKRLGQLELPIAENTQTTASPVNQTHISRFERLTS